MNHQNPLWKYFIEPKGKLNNVISSLKAYPTVLLWVTSAFFISPWISGGQTSGVPKRLLSQSALYLLKGLLRNFSPLPSLQSKITVFSHLCSTLENNIQCCKRLAQLCVINVSYLVECDLSVCVSMSRNKSICHKVLSLVKPCQKHLKRGNFNTVWWTCMRW